MKRFDPTAMKQFSGLNDEMVHSLVVTFGEELQSSNLEIKEAIETRNWQLARRLIHTMRPGFVMFGEQDASTLMGEILEHGIGEDHPGSIEKLNRYLEISRDLQRQISEYLTTYPGNI